MKKFMALMLALAMVLSLVACGSNNTADNKADTDGSSDSDWPEPLPREKRDPISKEDLKIGVILVHDENSGYDVAHIDGITGACEALGIDMAQVTFKYNIGEDETCYDAAVQLAEDGCQLIISDSYGHQSHMMQAASEYEDIMFVAATGDTAAYEPVVNVVNVFPYTFQSRYVSGVVAGMKLKEMMDNGTATDPYVGYVGAYPYAEVVSGYTAFFLGVQSIVPEAHMDVQYTNSWYDPVAEGEAANALMAKGCVIIGQHADSTGAPSAVQAALDGGKEVYSVGYNIDMLSVAPDAALTSAQNNWPSMYYPILERMVSGDVMYADFALGAENDGVMISKLGPNCAEGTQEKVDEIWAALKNGSLSVFDTSKFTVEGKEVTSFLALDMDGDFVGDVGEAIVDGVFQESVLRSAPYFSLRIDGITELNN